MRKLLLTLVVACLPSMSQAADWWVVIGYFDHPPMEWDDGVLTKANDLEAALTDCGLSAFWDFTAKFDGFDTDGRGSVFVINTFDRLNRAAAENLLAATKPCVPDAYIKEATYFGE
jgi:hypothetical protein